MAFPLHAPSPFDVRQPPQPASGQAAFLDALREAARASRVKSRSDLFRTCALLHGDNHADRRVWSEALMCCLNEALGRNAILHHPGAQELSFDESWLLQLGLSIARGDTASTQFLLRSRVAKENRRLLAFLISQNSECFSLL